MLQITSGTRDASSPDLEFPLPSPASANAGEMLILLRQRARTIGGILAAALLSGTVYALLATPQYTAVSSLFIDARKAAQQSILGDPISDSAIVESQVEVLRSQTIARAVIDKLQLEDDVEFNGTPRNLVSRALHNFALYVGAKGNPAADPKMAAALRAFGRDLNVSRIGLSYVLQVQFTSESAAKAARIANAVMATYLDEVLAAKAQAVETTNAWLQQQMDELRKRTVAATAAVQQFKSQTELIDSHSGALENTAKLRDLESVAQGYRAIYDNFVQRYAETMQNSSPTVEARVITHAIIPELKSWPKLALILPAAAFFGAAFGILIALLQDRLDRSFRAPGQVEAKLGLKCLGMLPVSTAAQRPIELHDAEGRQLTIAAHGVMHQVLDAPLSFFTETMRSVKVAIDVRDRTCSTKVIGVTSTLVGEGKTTAAFSLAALSADGGTRTLLIEANLRNPQLTRMLAGRAPFALRNPLRGGVALEHAVVTHRATGLDILPVSFGGSVAHPEALLLSPAIQDLFTQARTAYGLVIVDLPAIAPTADVRAVSHLLDAVLLVIQWGKTSRDVIEQALAFCDIDPEQSLGVLLNKVDLAEYRRAQWPLTCWTGELRAAQGDVEDPGQVSVISSAFAPSTDAQRQPKMTGLGAPSQGGKFAPPAPPATPPAPRETRPDGSRRPLSNRENNLSTGDNGGPPMRIPAATATRCASGATSASLFLETHGLGLQGLLPQGWFARSGTG